MKTIRSVAVIGAGTMGAGIAGQVANAGLDVWLLDIPSEGDNPNALAQRGLERLKNPDSPGLVSEAAAAHIHIGNTRDDLHRIAECDWVAEAIVERLDIKHQLYREVAEHLSDTALLSSNTSTIPISLLTQGMPESLAQRFAITHFFNPVRFMHLLELVRGDSTSDAVMDSLAEFCENQLGKGVVRCRDTPGFLANRVGCFAIQCALHEAFAQGIAPAEADALFGRPMGIPKTGVFGLYDLIGIDLMADVAKSLVSILPAGDAFHAVGEPLPQMLAMIDNDQRGNKSGQGFYRDHHAQRQVFDFASQTYTDFARPRIAVAERAEQEGVGVLLADDSPHGRYAWSVLSQTLCYAAELLPEVGIDPLAIDDAMRLGYNWQHGPFALLDQIGVAAFVERLVREQRSVPPYLASKAACYRVQEGVYQRRLFGGEYQAVQRPAKVQRLYELRRSLERCGGNASASWYAYRDVAIVEFHTKANALDTASMQVIELAMDGVEERGLKGLVIHNDAQHFSCGVNLEAVRGFYRRDDYAGLDAFLKHFQDVVSRVNKAPFPVVAAPVGMSIGGGFEVVLHAQYVIAHANSVTGLVESGVGLVPGGGGCKEMLYRHAAREADIDTAAWKAFMALGFAQTANAPGQAQDLGMLRTDDEWQINRDHLLHEAVELALTASPRPHYRSPIAMAGRDAYAKMLLWLQRALQKGHLSAHETVIGSAIARIVSGGDIDPGTEHSEQDLFDAERREFLVLAKSHGTQVRINTMLDTGQKTRT